MSKTKVQAASKSIDDMIKATIKRFGTMDENLKSVLETIMGGMQAMADEDKEARAYWAYKYGVAWGLMPKNPLKWPKMLGELVGVIRWHLWRKFPPKDPPVLFRYHWTATEAEMGRATPDRPVREIYTDMQWDHDPAILIPQIWEVGNERWIQGANRRLLRWECWSLGVGCRYPVKWRRDRLLATNEGWATGKGIAGL